MLCFSRKIITCLVLRSPKSTPERSIGIRCLKEHLLGSHKAAVKYRDKPIIMKLDSPEFKSLFTPELIALATLFEKYNYEIRIAGGAVRDLLMGKTPKDLDFATVATPDQMKEMFIKEEIRMINQRGESHGTITPRFNDKENFEVTTLRVDVETDGRHAKVVFTQDWFLDANRRDLTINSMFLGFDGTVYDYFNGYEDLKKKKVVFVGRAEDRIKEDYLRILRYFRFFGRISADSKNFDQETIDVISSNLDGLSNIAGERIWSELRLIIAGNNGPHIFEKMLSIGIGPHIGFPKELNMDELRRVIERSKGVELNPVTYLAAVLNNMTEALALNSRLKMSVYERELAYFIVANREKNFSLKPLLPFQKLMLNSKFKVSDVREWCVEVLRYNGQHKLSEEMKEWNMPKLPVSGNDLKDHVTQSKKMALVVRKLKDYWAENDFKPGTEELVSLVPKILEETNQTDLK